MSDTGKPFEVWFYCACCDPHGMDPQFGERFATRAEAEEWAKETVEPPRGRYLIREQVATS